MLLYTFYILQLFFAILIFSFTHKMYKKVYVFMYVFSLLNRVTNYLINQ